MAAYIRASISYHALARVNTDFYDFFEFKERHMAKYCRKYSLKTTLLD